MVHLNGYHLVCRWMLCALLTIGVATLALANNDYPPPHGFHWYSVDPQPQKILPQTSPTSINPVVQMQALRAMVNEALDTAILYPSVQHATRYLALNNLLMHNASGFTLAMQQALIIHPEMSYALTHPTQSAAKKVMLHQQEAVAIQAVKTLLRHNGCFFFYRGQQPLDQLMAKTVAAFAKQVNMPVVGISVDGKVLSTFSVNRYDHGQAKKLGVKAYPALLLVNPQTHAIQPISYGVLSQSELLHRFWLVATHFAKEEA